MPFISQLNVIVVEKCCPYGVAYEVTEKAYPCLLLSQPAEMKSQLQLCQNVLEGMDTRVWT